MRWKLFLEFIFEGKVENDKPKEGVLLLKMIANTKDYYKMNKEIMIL